MGNKSDINKIVKNFLEVQIDCIKEIQEQSETIDKIIKIIISTKNKNKTIGIIGYGNIGSQLSVICESLGMKVIYYDIVDKLSIGNAKKHDSLDSILKESDIVSLHVDGREDNTNLIGEREINLMKEKSNNFHVVFLKNSVAMDVEVRNDLTYRIIGGVFHFKFFLGDKNPETAIKMYHEYLGG